ncbi:MAG: hypothetical protein ACERIH_11465 [Labilibaculum antarcticum]
MRLEFSVPDRCQSIGNSIENIELGPNQTYLHIVSVFIPESIKSGAYSVFLFAADVEEKTITLCPVKFKIEKLVDFEIVNNKELSYVFSGDTIYSEFQIQSKSNGVIKLKVEGMKCTIIGDSLFSLQPDSTHLVLIKIITAKRSRSPEDYHFQIIGTAEQDKSLRKFGYGKVKVFPRESGPKSIYLAYPVTLSITFLGIKRNDKFKYGLQGSLEGQGYIDKDQKNYYGFKIIGPNRYGKSVLGNLDEYMMFYRNSLFDVKVGDLMFSSTKLTESSRSGHGFDIKLKASDFTFGGFYLKPRFYSKIKNEYSFSVKYNGVEDLIMETHYISKKSTQTKEKSDLFAILGKGLLYKGLSYETEFSCGTENFTNNMALYCKNHYSSRIFQSNFSFLYTTSEFKGYYKGTSNWQGSANLLLSKKLFLTMNFRKDETNSQRDSLLGEAPLAKVYQLGLQYRYSKSGTFNLRGGNRARKDRMPTARFDYMDKNLTLGMSQQLENFTLKTAGDFAFSEDFLSGKKGLSYKFDYSLNYSLKKNRFNISGSYEKSGKYGLATTKQFIYGGGISLSSKDNSNLSASFRSSYSIEDYYLDRSLLDFNYSRSIANNQKLELSLNYSLLSKSLDQNDFSVGLKYILQFNAPLKKRIDVGYLSGKITRIFAKNSKGIIVFFNGRIAVTDKDGCFMINGIEPGKHFLIIDRNSLNINEMPVVKTPIEIEIKKGENFIQFEITKQAQVKPIFVFTNSPVITKDNKREVSDYTKKREIMIEMTNEISSVKRIIDINKSITFDNLLPGRWKLLIKKKNPKDDFDILKNEYDLDLNPEEKRTINIKLDLKRRKINYSQEGFTISISK